MTRMNPGKPTAKFDPRDDPPLFRELDELGERAVRLALAKNVWGPPKRPLVEEWLRRQSEDRAAASARSASRARWFSVAAAVVSAAAAVVSAVVMIGGI